MIDFIGIDPDTKTTGVALLHDTGKIELMLARSKGRLALDRMLGMGRSIRAALARCRSISVNCQAAVEWQHIRPVERNPNSMMGVQAVAGMSAMALAQIGFTNDNTYLPVPNDWKGSVSKQAMHPRILAEAGLTKDSNEFQGIPASMHQHVIDALGICFWLKRGRKLR